MPEMDFDELIMRIVKASKLTKHDVIARINAKVAELSGLVSKRGAAHIVANSFGIQLHESKKGKTLSLGDVVDGLNNVSVKGVVTRVFPINEFDKNGRKGRVANVVINDGTAESRLVFWNEMAEIVAAGRLSEGDLLKVHHVRSKKGNYGMELHLSARSRVELNPDEERPVVKSFSRPGPARERYLICDLQEGLNVEIRGAVVQMYDRSPFFDICPECGKSAKGGKCSDHGEVTPAKGLIVNAVFDDGTGSVRCVFFKQQAEALLGCSTDQVIKLSNELGDEAAIIKDKSDLLGSVFVVGGKVVRNDYFDTLEIMVNSVVVADPLVEVKKLLDSN